MCSPNGNLPQLNSDLVAWLVTEIHHIPIMDSPILMMLRKFQCGAHILGHEKQLLLLL